MTEPPQREPPGESEVIGGLLANALHVDPPGSATLQRLHDAAAQAWEQSISTPPRPAWSRTSLWLAAAAAVVVGALGLVWVLRPFATAETFGTVVRVVGSEGEIAESLLRHRPLTLGAALNVGDQLTTRGPVLIALRAGGTLRIAAGSLLEVPSASLIRLPQGLVYLDLPSAVPVRLATRAGILEHIGTEFEVFSDAQTVRIRVREGRLRLRNASRQTLIDTGIQLTANPDGTLTQSPVTPYGADWLWVAALTPDYDIEGQPLLNFLQWAARELGRPLGFADAHAREIAVRTVLHGSVKGREPLEALRAVLSTTSLRYEIRGDTIWVQSSDGT
jgi:hypothetical protein